MPLGPGTRLGPYEILSAIGAGGMGEVYHARDTRLKRDVALKILPDLFASDPERLARFQREAEVLASLNHHNIAGIYGLEESNGTRALVMELVEGETLAARIGRGPIPLDEALTIARQIAEALEGAHEQGIIHRDLKPANIKVRSDGMVKVLDFGLAKLTEMGAGIRDQGSDGARGSLSLSPTITSPAMMTGLGMLLGTAAYMSPEQARGRVIDKRADIWAFGAILYEMVTGRQLFRGEDVTETLASVLMKEPELEAAPRRVQQLLRRCLEKDPTKRLRDISGVALLLEQQEPHLLPATSVRTGGAWRWEAVAASLAIVAAVLGAGWYRAQPGTSVLRPLTRLDVDLGPDVTLSSSALSGSDVILSADGHRLAYISQARLFTRSLDQPVATELAGTDGAYGAFFSPDGRWLAFFAGGKLKKISVEGGAAITLCDASGARGGTWGEDGTIIAALATTGPLWRIPAAGGKPAAATALASGETVHRWPQFLPGGKAVVFTASSTTSGFQAASIKVRSLVDGSTKVLQQGGTYGRVIGTQPGHTYLTYVKGNTVFAARFDATRLEVIGSPSPVLDGVGSLPTGTVEMDLSMDGTVVYRGLSGGTALMTLQWMDSAGAMQPLITKPGFYGRPSVSPDGTRTAVEVSSEAGSDIWIYDSRRDNMSRLTFGGVANVSPLWSQDGRYIVFQDPGGLSWVRSDGGAAQLLLRTSNLSFPWSFTPDGSRLAYMVLGALGYDVWTVPLDGDAVSGMRPGKPSPLLNSDFDERYPSFSPDGKWLAYSSNESGTYEVYVRPFPDKGVKWQISNAGGAYPMWSRTGHELFYETLDARIMSVPYTFTNDSFVADKSHLWSQRPLVNLVNSSKNVDLAPDGRRMAVLMPVETSENQGARNHVTFLLNFLDELERRLPAGK